VVSIGLWVESVWRLTVLSVPPLVSSVPTSSAPRLLVRPVPAAGPAGARGAVGVVVASGEESCRFVLKID
jgi:hypothetical protein